MVGVREYREELAAFFGFGDCLPDAHLQTVDTVQLENHVLRPAV